MIGIEERAYNNNWRVIHPRDKIIFALVTMLLGLFSPWTLPSLIVLLIMVYLTVFQAKIPGCFYIKLLLIPAGFLVIGAIGVGLTVSLDHSSLIWGIKLGAYYLGITQAGMDQAMLLLARSAGAVSCLFLLALTTPLEDITSQLERWGVPYIMIEMMTLVYRFIFIFWERAITIHTAQAARLGHVDIKTSLRSLGYLISSLFFQTMERTNTLYNSLVARGYTDSLRVLEEEHKPTHWHVKLGFISFDLILLGLILFKGSVLL